MKPRVKHQGKIIIEYYGMYDYMVMFPSGRVTQFRNRSQAEKAAKRYFSRRKVPVGCLANIGVIEWRNKK
jgi:hypothetical protein